MSVFPRTAFIDPSGGNRTEIETLLQKAVTLLLDEMTQASRRSPLPNSGSPAEALTPLTQWASIPERWLTAVLLNPYTQRSTIDALFTRIDTFIESRLLSSKRNHCGG